jgi:hypothetical protein
VTKGVVHPIGARKKQTARLLKVECLDCAREGKPYIGRFTAAPMAVDDRGAPLCPVHQMPMHVTHQKPNDDDGEDMPSEAA